MFLVFTLASVLVLQTLQMALPDGNRAWVVRVITSGGLTGNGVGDFAISSEGKLLCRPEKGCPTQFKPADFQSLVETLVPGTLSVPLPPAGSLCSDCILRTIYIQRRDSTGTVHLFTASWDDLTRERIPPEVIRVYDALLALRDVH